MTEAVHRVKSLLTQACQTFSWTRVSEWPHGNKMRKSGKKRGLSELSVVLKALQRSSDVSARLQGAHSVRLTFNFLAKCSLRMQNLSKTTTEDNGTELPGP